MNISPRGEFPSSKGQVGWPWDVEPSPLNELAPAGQPWPRITIVTPSYNQGIFLEATIRSVLLQDYPNLEYIVIDGGSSDQSIEILQEYAPWLFYWESMPDRGQSHAINKGWARASGDLIAYLNSDDIYLPGTLKTVALTWMSNPEVAMVAGGVRFIDEYGKPKSERKAFLKDSPIMDLSLRLPGDWFFPQQAAFFGQECLDQVGRWLREDLHYTMDRELMYRLSCCGKIVLVDEILAGDRHHPDTKRTLDTLTMYREDARALAYCRWGGPLDNLRRFYIARWRKAQGHYRMASRASVRRDLFKQILLTLIYQPLYLKRRGFQKLVLRSLGLLEFVENLYLVGVSKNR